MIEDSTILLFTIVGIVYTFHTIAIKQFVRIKTIVDIFGILLYTSIVTSIGGRV